MFNRLARIGVITASAVALVGLLGGTAYAKTFDPQPYIVYQVPPQPVIPPALVDLQDQFIELTAVPVENREYLMNPVEKIPVAPPGDPELRTDPALHYRWFPIGVSEPEGSRVVRVSNQFGDEVHWRISAKPSYLLAPASKAELPATPDDPPTTGHHYNCYEPVLQPLMVNATVDLLDQFGPHPGVEVTAARYLCVPVEKTKGPDVFPILEATDGRDHLACYDIPPLALYDVDVETNDQFGLTLITDPEVDTFLCVPSTKYYRVPSLAPWGVVGLGLSLLLVAFWAARQRKGQTA